MFLGTGNSFVPMVKTDKGGFDCAWQSNLLLEIDDRKILLDCGTDIRFALAEQGLDASDIEGVYISHIHADHMGGMEWLAFNTFFNPKKEKPILYCVEEILEPLRTALMPGLSPLKGETRVFEDFFDVVVLHANPHITHLSDTFDVVPISAIHIPSETPKQSYGLILMSRDPLHNIFWTSDTIFEPTKYLLRYEFVDVILQDCELGPRSGVHAHIEDLRTLPAEIKKKMWLYHHSPDLVSEAGVEEAEFAGFATKGQTFEF